MSKTIETKRCSKCKKIKPLSEFYKDRSKKDGLQHRCKICLKIFISHYQKTKKGKATKKRYRQTDKGKAYYKRYMKTEKGKAAQKRYQQSEKGKRLALRRIKKYNQTEKGKLSRKRARQRYCKTEIGRKKAAERTRKHKRNHPFYPSVMRKIRIAIRDEILPDPKKLKCINCGKKAKDYHHHLGYAKEHRLDVIPVCRLCHLKIHNKSRTA